MIKEIKHKFHFTCRPNVVVSALTEEKQIRSWWVRDGIIKNGQGEFHWKGYDWTVELEIENPNENTVIWKCSKSNMQDTNAWEGSTMTFKLREDIAGTALDFTHSNYKDAPCYQACHDGWKYFLGESLKNYIETGLGMAYAA